MLPRASVLLMGLALLAGCAGLDRSRERPVASGEAIQAAQLASHIGALQRLVQGSPAEQAEVLAEARAGYESAQQGPAALRYALLLAAPSHPARDLATAQRLLRETLARPELLSPLERALAQIELARVERETGLAADNERLVAEAQAERERARNAPANAALTRRLQAADEENARLRRLLDEAEAKLDAIANIESRITDRKKASEGRQP